MTVAEFAPILQYAGENGPYLFIIGLLLRSVVQLNNKLQENNTQLIEMAVTAQKALSTAAQGGSDAG